MSHTFFIKTTYPLILLLSLLIPYMPSEAMRFHQNEQKNSFVIQKLIGEILENTKKNTHYSFLFTVDQLDQTYVLSVSGLLPPEFRGVLERYHQNNASMTLELKLIHPGYYELISSNQISAQKIRLSIAISNELPEHILPFGATLDESRHISNAIVQTVLSGREEGGAELKPIENNAYAKLPGFTGWLTFILTNITFSDEFEHQDFPQECGYQLKKLGEGVSRYYIQIETPGKPWIAFNLTFISGITYDGWQKLIRHDEPLLQGQYNATAFHTHCLVGDYVPQPISTMCLVTVGWVAELQLCYRMLAALKNIDIFAYIFVVPNTFDGKSYGGMNNQEYSSEKVACVEDLRRRFFGLFKPQFTFLTHYSLEPNRIADEYIIGYWSGFVSYVTTSIEKALLGCDSIAYSSNQHDEIDALLEKNSQTKPLHFFAPSSQKTTFEDVALKRLFYCGINWDKLRSSDRYKAFFALLEKTGSIDIYGPKKSWDYLDTSYKGIISPGTDELYTRMKDCGVVLCLHSEEHLQYGISSSRFFEAVSSSCLVICDQHPFFTKAFKDCCLFLDEKQPANKMAEQVVNHLKWIKKNPMQAKEMCKKAHQVFLDRYALEKQFYDTFLGIQQSIQK